MTDGRSSTLTVLIVAALVGLIGGLVLAWFVSPVEYTDVGPSELRPEFQTTYLQLVGASFAFESDWTRAEFRLNALGLDKRVVARQIAEVTDRAITEGRPAPILRAMSRMSDRLGARTAAMIAYLATPVPTVAPSATPTTFASPSPTAPSTPTPTPTFAPPDTPTPLPTFTPTPTPQLTWLRVGQERVCEPGPPQIRVVVEDEKGQGVPGTEVWVTWDGGADRFVTGLKPEKGNGYGDVEIQPGIVYAVAIAESALPIVDGIKTELCPSSSPTQTLSASWQLTFRPVPPTPTPSPTPGPSPTPTATASPTYTPGPSPTATRTVTVTVTLTATRTP